MFTRPRRDFDSFRRIGIKRLINLFIKRRLLDLKDEDIVHALWKHKDSFCVQRQKIHMRETVRSISGVGARALRGAFHSTRGPGRTHLWYTSYHANGKRWVAKCGVDNR